MSLSCLLLPGLLLLALLPNYYITKRAEFSLSNIAGAFGMAALFPYWILFGPLDTKQNVFQWWKKLPYGISKLKTANIVEVINNLKKP